MMLVGVFCSCGGFILFFWWICWVCKMGKCGVKSYLHINIKYQYLMNILRIWALAHFFLIIIICRQFAIQKTRFVDSQGGQTTFHGINLVQKSQPFYNTQFADQDLKMFKQWGLNGIRLGVMWPGVEPEEGKYNDTYLQVMVDLVNKAGKQYGIYTLVEFHQDLFSSLFCGDGVPTWALSQDLKQNFPFPYVTTQNPKNKICQQKAWSDFYFTYAVNEQFSRLYTNANHLLDKFVGYWKKVATAFKDNPYVIGYQIINEPWPGNFYKEFYVMIPGISEKIHLQQFYDRVSLQIRSIDPEQNICAEPITWVNWFPTGLQHAPGGSQYANRSMLCFHYYNPPISNMDEFLFARQMDMNKLNIGGMLTQFFVETSEAEWDMNILDKCEKMFLSWFGWMYHKEGTKPYIFKRTYAQRVAGNKHNELYNNITKQYQLMYTSNSSAGQTRIFFNYDHYLYEPGYDKDNEMSIKDHIGYSVSNDKLTWNKNNSQLNMQISIFPSLGYQIRQKMYVIIDSKNASDRMILVKIKRKKNYDTKAHSREKIRDKQGDKQPTLISKYKRHNLNVNTS